MPKIIQTTQTGLSRLFAQFGRGIERRDVWSTRDYYANRWSTGGVNKHGF
jgi:hypothetical protein